MSGTVASHAAGERGEGRLPGHGWLPEPVLRFHPERVADATPHPLDGLLSFGPYGRATVNRVLDPIRVGVVAPAGGVVSMDGLLRELERPHRPRERPHYLREFPGFSKVFGVRLVAAPDAQIELGAAFNDKIAASEAPHVLLADRMTKVLQHLAVRRDTFDVLLVYLPDRWRAGFWGPEGDDFDLHDYIKAVAALLDIPTQVINEDGSLAYHCRCSVAWRLGIALYCKAGGIPWRLAADDPGVAYVGISYALRRGADGRTQFVTCCSQVFDADGTGLECLAYSPDDVAAMEGDNPYLSREDMRRVMARTLGLYQRRHAGGVPRRVVVHKTTEFKEAEVDGCFDALRASEGIELVQVQQDTPWQGIAVGPPRPGGKRGVPGGYPVERGSYLPLGGRDVLLWTQGDAPTAVGGRHFYKEGKGIPAPLHLRRFAGHGGWETACADVLGLTKMNWNHDGLYDRLPVTLGFADTLADVVKRMDRLGSRAFPIRLFM